jgi:hypothetical protein
VLVVLTAVYPDVFMIIAMMVTVVIAIARLDHAGARGHE